MTASNGRRECYGSSALKSAPPSIAEAWSSPVLVLASDRTRAEIIVSGLGLAPSTIEITGDPGWSADRLRMKLASLIIVATPQAEHGLLMQILAAARFRSIPMIVFVDQSTREDTNRVLKLGVSAFIVDGLEADRIPAIVDVARERHAMTEDLHERLKKSQEDLAARKIIERAKGLLMSRSGRSEQEVYDSMRRLAMTQGKPLREIADTVLMLSAVFG